VERCRPLLLGKPLTLQFVAVENVSIQAIPELVTIALSNLIRNACQYTELGSINVRLERSQIIMEDSGAGLPEVVRARLFDRFVRGSESYSSSSGLGLSIVKRVTEHLAWTVSHDVSAYGGSRFRLEIANATREAA